MRTYHFHMTEGDKVFPDTEGVELPDSAAAQREAIHAASGLMAEAVNNGEFDYRGRIDVEDEHGRKVLMLAFACPITVEMAPPPLLHSV